jgi:hypothetical protein
MQLMELAIACSGGAQMAALRLIFRPALLRDVRNIAFTHS